MRRNLKKGDVFEVTSRKGRFVVVETHFDGGGTGHGPLDVYPNGHRVVAKKLKEGKWDSKGRKLEFYQSGCFTNMILPKDIDVVGEMKQKWE